MFIHFRVPALIKKQAGKYLNTGSTRTKKSTIIGGLCVHMIFSKSEILNTEGGFDLDILGNMIEVRTDLVKLPPPQPKWDVSVIKRRPNIKKYIFCGIDYSYSDVWVYGRITAKKFFQIADKYLPGDVRKFGKTQYTYRHGSWDLGISKLTHFSDNANAQARIKARGYK